METSLILLCLLMANVGVFKLSCVVNEDKWLNYTCIIFGILYLIIGMIVLCLLPMLRVREIIMNEEKPKDVLKDYSMGDNFAIVGDELQAKSFTGFVEGVKYVYDVGGFIPMGYQSYKYEGIYATTIKFPEHKSAKLDYPIVYTKDPVENYENRDTRTIH